VKEKTSAATVRLAQEGVQVRLSEAMAATPSEMEDVEAEAEAADGAPVSFLQSVSIAIGVLGSCVLSCSPRSR